MPSSTKRDGDLLQEIHLLLHAALHTRVDDGVAELFAPALREEREDRAPIHFGERHGVERCPFVARWRAGHLVDLRREDSLVGDDLAELAVEGDFESAVG